MNMKLSAENLQQIGAGCNSSIYKLQEKDSQKGLVFKSVAVDNKKQADHLRNQYQFLSSLHHQNIISPLLFKTNIPFAGANSHVIVLQYANRGCLLDFIKKQTLSVEQSRYIFNEVVKGLSYLHSQNIAHRDLKMQNILVFQREGKIMFKLADFGFAESTIDTQNNQEKKVKGIKGTKRGYMAPEIHVSLQKKQSYTLKNTDIFALGETAF